MRLRTKEQCTYPIKRLWAVLPLHKQDAIYHHDCQIISLLSQEETFLDVTNSHVIVNNCANLMNLTHRGRADASAMRRLNRFSNRSCSCGVMREKSGGHTFLFLYSSRGRLLGSKSSKEGSLGLRYVVARRSDTVVVAGSVLTGRKSAGRQAEHGDNNDGSEALGRATRRASLCNGVAIVRAITLRIKL